MTVPNSDFGISLFKQSQTSTAPRQRLMSSQVDHTLPQTVGLSRITDPLLPTENISQALQIFDPDVYDLRPTSHLVRFLQALIGSAGVGGLRKQLMVSRLAATLSSANFTDLDSFYGAIFNFKRYAIEGMPTTADGSTLNPYTDTATPDVWDDAQSRDARFRSRIKQLAQAINMGGTRAGIKAVAEAVLSCEVDLIEVWINKIPTLVVQNLPTASTYANMSNQFVYYGQIQTTYGDKAGKVFASGYMPGDNLGEVVLTPRRIITSEEQLQLAKVLDTVKPSHIHITISNATNETNTQVPPRALASDSEDWDVICRITPADLNQSNNVLYSNGSDLAAARPLFSEYAGESWSYNPNIVRTYSYQISNGSQINSPTEETVIYQDGTSHLYKATDAIMDDRQAISVRLSGDGVVTAYPYVGDRSILTKAPS